MDATAKDLAQRKVSFARKYKGPFGNEQQHLDKLNFGATVRVFNETSRTWEGSFKLVSKNEETLCVKLSHGRRLFALM